MYQPPGNRPRFLNLLAFHFPLNAWLSVGHRLSGLVLVCTLLGYLALMNLLLLNQQVTLDAIRDHCILQGLHTLFWISLSFHWLTGLRHLLAESFIEPKRYAQINSSAVSYSLLSIWGVLSLTIIYQAWSL